LEIKKGIGNMVKKRKTDIKVIWILIILAIAIITISYFSKNNPTGNSIIEPNTPANCTATNISALWSTIFNDAPTGITATFQDDPLTPYCDAYLAMKKINDNELFLLYGSETTTKKITAIHGNFTSNFISQITSLVTIGTQDRISLDEKTTIANLISNSTARSTTITAMEEANIKFYQIFKTNSQVASWQLDSINKFYSYGEFEENDLGEATRSAKYYIATERIVEKYYFFKGIEEIAGTPGSCTPNWTKHNTSCTINETKIEYYADQENCGNNSTQPENETVPCDYNLNNILGKISDAEINRIVMKIKIEEEDLNQSLNYTGEQTVEIYDSNESIIEFDWDFDAEPLNIFDIEIEKQANSSSFGYLVVKGIDSEKTIKIDKKSSTSNSVCVKDSSSASISSLTSNCNATDERIVPCPGSNGGYACSASPTKLTITGLDHSIVKEFSNGNTIPLTTTISTCTPNWNCSSWSACSSGKKTRTCTDNNSCNNNSAKPNISENCTETSTCTPSWNCGDWSPGVCPSSGSQTRTCIDSNVCGVASGKPSETQTCTYEGSSFLTFFIIIIILIGLGLGGFFLIKRLNKEPGTNTLATTQTNSPPPSGPPMMNRPVMQRPIQRPQPIMNKPTPPRPPQNNNNNNNTPSKPL
jgi:hypothetical protein